VTRVPSKIRGDPRPVNRCEIGVDPRPVNPVRSASIRVPSKSAVNRVPFIRVPDFSEAGVLNSANIHCSS